MATLMTIAITATASVNAQNVRDSKSNDIHDTTINADKNDNGKQKHNDDVIFNKPAKSHADHRYNGHDIDRHTHHDKHHKAYRKYNHVIK